MTAESSAPVPQGLGPLGSAPAGQVRIYLGSAHRFIWPVHLAGWLDLGWTTEPGANGPGVAPRATPGVAPRATPRATPGANGPGVTRTPSKTRRINKEKNLIEVIPTEPNPISEIPIETNPTNESPVGASPSGVNPVGVGSAKADEPLPVLVTDFLVDLSVPTND